MPQALPDDQELVVSIIAESFRDNPSVLSVIKNDRKKQQRIEALARFAFSYGLRRQGVWLSEDRQAVAICYHYNQRASTLFDLADQVKLIFRSIGISRLMKVAKRDSYLKKQRPKDDCLYFWFFGITDAARGNGSALALKNELFSYAKRLGLPIILETSVSKNKRVYERYAFEVYHQWIDPAGNNLWFMKRSAPKK